VNGSLRLPAAPDLAALHSAAPEQWPFLLESTTRGGTLGRWSLLLHAAEASAPLLAGPGDAARFLDHLDQAWQSEQAQQPGQLPFEGGWFVYLGYELAAGIESRLDLPPADDGLPVALARRCDAAVLIDHHDNESWLVAETSSVLQAAAEFVADSMAGKHARTVEAIPIELLAEDGDRFKRGVERIRDYILAGDVFQVNLSRAWSGIASTPLDPVAIHRRLSAANPAPFAGLARLPGGTLLSSSPERLVAVRDGMAEVRPIAGTRPRGSSAAQDRALSEELLGHPKERAEHIMLIDLERNDLGRICVPGTVRVDELMTIESYAHVHHIVSNVVGRLVPDSSPGDIIRAVFPGGTITGCPKVRCMEIIAELEQRGRSFYTGAMGYLGLDGRIDLNILIRSMLVQHHTIRFRTGAGIVADSEPAAELAETEAKARGLARALDAL
jgi:anthranilate synthase component 1